MSDRLSIEEIVQLVDLAVSRGVSIAVGDVVITPCHVTNDKCHVTDAKSSADGAAELLAIRAAQTAERQRRCRERRAASRHVTQPECHVTQAISPPPPLSLSPSPSPSLPPPPSPAPPSSPAHTPAPPPTHPHTPTPALNRGQAHTHAREADAAESQDSGATDANPGELHLGDPMRFRQNRRDSQPKPSPAKLRRAEAERTSAITGLPPELDTPAFRDAWAEWNAHRADMAEADKRKPWTPRAAAAALRMCADAGAAAAVTEIRRAIASNWTGIHFHEPARKPTNGHHPKPGMPDPFAPIDWNNPNHGVPNYWGKQTNQTAKS